MDDLNKPYAVCCWGSHPDDDNDDCWTGEDFATRAEAEAAFLIEPSDPSTAFVEIDGPDVNRVRPVPGFRKRSRAADDAEWRSEHAHQMGMGMGCDAYNDALED